MRSIMAGKRSSRRPPENEVQTRPLDLNTKQGTAGRPVKLQANYFTLNSKPDWCLYQYDVKIVPDEERTFVRKALLRTKKDTIGAYMFDGTTLYTIDPLPKTLEFTTTRKEDNAPVIIKIQFVENLDNGDYHYFQLYNLIIRRTLEHLQLQLVGRNYFDAAERIVIRDFKLELWPGYITSIRQHEQSILMCCDISHKIMRDETLFDILNDCFERDRKNWKTKFQQEVIGCVVLTAYNNRTYRVDDVDFAVDPSHTFKLKDGSNISYANYYKQKYQIKIHDMTQPLLVSKSTMRKRRAGEEEIIYLIPELCRSTGLTDRMKSDFRLMKAVSEHTRVAPSARIDRLLNFNHRLRFKAEIVAELKDWAFSLDPKLVELRGRVLPPEIIYFGNKKTVQLNDDADWNFPLQDQPQLRVGQFNDWVAIVPKQLDVHAKTFIDVLIKAGAKVGIIMTRPRLVQITNDKTDTYADALSKITDQQKPQLILCVVSNNQAMRYAMIKKKLCLDRPTPSQVVLARTLQQRSPSMMNAVGCKVVTQMNCKIGGIPWTVNIAQKVPGLMIVGFDVCHVKKSEGSWGAMVASLDQNFGRYFSAVSQHQPGQELSNDISIQLVRALQEFIKENGRKPSCILFYRDGVGEGQLPFVHDFEVEEIKKKLATVYGQDPYKLGFIVVTKRINTRFFLNKQNPKPGTVVDDVVTDPLKYDFFIVSQNVRQGTVSPTSYNIIEDSTGLNPNALQGITFKLCHMYFNFSGTVRVPAPCQYAHKLAFFAAQTLQKSPDKSLEKTLYFL